MTVVPQITIEQPENICGTPYTIDWVIALIKEKLNVPNAVLNDYSFVQIGKGQGFCSTVVRVTLEWNRDEVNEELPTSVVLKVPTTVNVREKIESLMTDAGQIDSILENMNSHLCTMHNNEINAYDIFSNEKHAPIKLPTVYGWTTMKHVDEPGAILLEDFSARNAVVVNKVDGLRVKQMENIVDSLASMYAWSINSDGSFATRFELNEKSEDELADNMANMCGEVFEKHSEEFANIDQAWLNITRPYTRAVKCINTDVFEQLRIPAGLVHGDLWANNMLFEPPSDTEKVSSDNIFALIDWQTAHAGNPMEDLGRVLVSSCTPELRCQYKDVFIQRFYTKCCQKLDAPATFTLKDLHNAYDFNLPFAATFYVMSVGVMIDQEEIMGIPGTPTNERRRRQAIERAVAVVQDCEQVIEHVGQIMNNL